MVQNEEKGSGIFTQRFFRVRREWSIFLAGLIIAVSTINGASQLPLHPDRGVVVQISDGRSIPDHLPDTIGNVEVAYSWKELEPEEDVYDFTALDSVLEKTGSKGWKSFIQVTTRSHPDYIFQKVPYIKGKSWEGREDNDRGYGVPMCWHDQYRDRYAALLYNLGMHLKRSDQGEQVLGIVPDMTFWLGNEIPSFIEYARDTSNWILPGGLDSEEIDWWTDGTWSDQLEYLHEVHRRAGSGIGWMYQLQRVTNPGNTYQRKMASIFMDQCKGGDAFGYAWSGKKCPGEDLTGIQFLHWNMLYNLQIGASFLSVPEAYIEDTAFVDDLAYFEKYAGMAARLDTAPGIWMAFREGGQLKGDLTIGMERNLALPSTPLTMTGTGKFGLWGRKIGPESVIRLKMDEEFLESLHPKLKISIRVWYLDDDRSVFRIHAFNGIHSIQKTGTGEWKMAEITRRPLAKDQILDLVAMDGPLTVHMIEVARYGY